MRREAKRRGVVESAAVIVGAAFFLVFGAWAFFAPHSFFTNIAPWDPYNEHFLHDAGAFQIGVGAALALSFTTARGSVVGLSGAASAATLHAVSHVLDAGEGGRTTDPYVLAALALLLLLGLLAAWRSPR